MLKLMPQGSRHAAVQRDDQTIVEERHRAKIKASTGSQPRTFGCETNFATKKFHALVLSGFSNATVEFAAATSIARALASNVLSTPSSSKVSARGARQKAASVSAGLTCRHLSGTQTGNASPTSGSRRGKGIGAADGHEVDLLAVRQRLAPHGRRRGARARRAL